MSGEQNWRLEIDAEDYFGHQQKKNQVADRRPVIRRASDLVGPGIASSAVRVGNWNDVLATFNGYFSSVRALNGPQVNVSGPDINYDTRIYAGTVVMDGEYGGRQILTDLHGNMDYTRVFLRAPTDPNTISWGPWVAQSPAPPSAFAETSGTKVVPAGSTLTPLNAPALGGSNWEHTYESVGTRVDVLRPGVYSGVIRVSTNTTSTQATVSVTLPKGLVTETLTLASEDASAGNAGIRYPFTFVNLQNTSSVTVSAYHNAGFGLSVLWSGMDITRVGGVL